MTKPEVASALEDSTYEVLEGSALIDDDGRTESLASVDGDTEDIQSLADTDYSEESVVSEAVDDGPTPQLPQGPLLQSVTDSNITAIHDHKDTASPITPDFEPLRVKGPFRILFVGEQEEWAKTEVIRKIGQALAAFPSARMESSQFLEGGASYNVIPISSFADEAPAEVELIDASGVQLHVDECARAKVYHNSKGSSVHCLGVNNDKTVIVNDGNAYLVNNMPKAFSALLGDRESEIELSHRYRLPQLAVISNLSSQASRLDLDAARSALLGCSVPILDASDINQFLEQDAKELNRHLASICRKPETSEKKDQARTADDSSAASTEGSFLDTAKSYWSNLKTDLVEGRRPALFRVVMMELVLAFFLALGFYATLSSKGMTSGFVARDAKVQVASQSAALDSALSTLTGPYTYTGKGEISTGIFNSLSSSVSSIIPASSVQTVNSHDSSTALASTPPDKSLAAPLVHPLSPSANESQEFRTHLIGDRHIILTPPQSYAKLRRPPKIFIKVVRADQTIDATLAKLVEGVYAVELPREEAYGCIKLSIWTKSKPVLDQSFDLNFGSQWLKPSTYADAAQKFVQRAQQEAKGIEKITEKGITELQKVIPDAQKALIQRVNNVADRALALYNGAVETATSAAKEATKKRLAAKDAAGRRSKNAVRSARGLRRKFRV